MTTMRQGGPVAAMRARFERRSGQLAAESKGATSSMRVFAQGEALACRGVAVALGFGVAVQDLVEAFIARGDRLAAMARRLESARRMRGAALARGRMAAYRNAASELDSMLCVMAEEA
jgi:hypothetical protein